METLQMNGQTERWTDWQMDGWKNACQIYIFYDLCYSYNPYGIIIFNILKVQFWLKVWFQVWVIGMLKMPQKTFMSRRRATIMTNKKEEGQSISTYKHNLINYNLTYLL